MQGHVQHRTNFIAGGIEILAEQVQHGPHRADDQQAQGQERAGEDGGVGKEYMYRGFAVYAVGARREIIGSAPVRCRLAMVQHRICCNKNPLTG